MRQLYLEYSNTQILGQLVPEIQHASGKKTKVGEVRKEWALQVIKHLVAGIPWGQNLLILKKIKDIHARLYYIISTTQCGRSRDVLLNQIKADAYGRHRLEDKQHNFPETLPKHLAEQADEAVKDSYMLDFLGITKPVIERENEFLSQPS